MYKQGEGTLWVSEIKTAKVSPLTEGGEVEMPGGGGGVNSVVAGTNVTVDNTDPVNPIVNAEFDAGGQVDSVVAGDNITVDNTDPANPIVNAGGGTAFKAEREAGYFTSGISNNGWSKSPIGSYNGWGGSVPIDTASGFDQTNSRWVCPEGEAGIYMVGFWLKTNNNSAQVRNEKWRPYINGVATGFQD
ncbi:MAG: hypothetical protein P8R04_01835, partial [Gammaproteobacteria bacterium]|nr:hypothetical protein [Gammaproteobacteria bacterium]